jgi:hypothetical protein
MKAQPWPPAAGSDSVGRAGPTISAMAVRLGIGDFSRMTHLSVKGALGTYVARREIGADGPIRENYLVTEFDTDDESRHVTEVCWPISGTMPPP